MKKQVLNFIAASTILLFSGKLSAQYSADFEDLLLADNSYFPGAKNTPDTTFISGNASFLNVQSKGYWQEGWAYSNLVDTTTFDYHNLYGAITGKAYKGKNYAVGHQNAQIKLIGGAQGKTVNGLYVTNTSYAYGSMKSGDAYAKKFGGATGNDSDYFKLSIASYFGGELKKQGVDFYLADFRNADNSKDYIIKHWAFVDLSALGNTDSLLFTLSSSDTGKYGINTPLFFAIDELMISDNVTGISEALNENSLQVMPNPASDNMFIRFNGMETSASVKLIDVLGNVVLTKSLDESREGIDISGLSAGVYNAIVYSGNKYFTKKLIKK